MGSSYFGEPNMGNERSGSSRKGKKSNSDKPKQPQRGLGVAQLEKIRLHSQMGCSYMPSLHGPYPTTLNQEDMRVQTAYSSVPSSSSFSYSPSSSSTASYGFHPNMMMGLSEMDRSNIRYGDSQPSTTARWNPGNGTETEINLWVFFFPLFLEFYSIKKMLNFQWIYGIHQNQVEPQQWHNGDPTVFTIEHDKTPSESRSRGLISEEEKERPERFIGLKQSEL